MTVAAGARVGTRLDTWLRVRPDGVIDAFPGKVEIGQGIRTALAQIVADELDVALERVRIHPVDTRVSRDEGMTAGSRSIETSGETLRRVAADARRSLIERAASRLGVAPTELAVADGLVRAPSGAVVTYWELVDAELLRRDLSDVPVKSPADRRLIGRSMRRPDLEAKIAGRACFIQDLALPGMLHGRVVRPSRQLATLVAFDDASTRTMPGVVAVVRDGSFIGLVARTEHEAILALQHARSMARWESPAVLPGNDPRYLLGEATEEHVAIDGAGAGPEIGRVIAAEYSRPFIAHASLAPSCAVARLDTDGLTVWSHSQGVFALRHELAKVLELAEDRVRVMHAEGAGCYGHNGADDVALDAALLARALPGRPVRVQWMRDDEFAWEPYGGPAVIHLSAALRADGRIGGWTHEIWGYGHGSRPGRSIDGSVSLLAARHLRTPFPPAHAPRARSLASGALRNSEPLYRLPSIRVVDHHVPRSPLRVSALRTLGAHANVFAIESFIDELAVAAGADPLSFRIAHLDDPRAVAVLHSVTERSGWRGRRRDASGMGLGLARYKNAAAYFACVVEIRLERDIRVARVWGAVDAGTAIDPGGILNQAEGGIVQAVSWTLKERVRHDDTTTLSLGWDTYPVIGFADVPEIDVIVIDRPEHPPLGVGEAFAGPVSAAIANAVFDASGVRLRDLPLTRDQLIAAAS